MKTLIAVLAALIAIASSFAVTPAERIVALIPAKYEAKVESRDMVSWQFRGQTWAWRSGVGSTNDTAALKKASAGGEAEDCLPNVLRLAEGRTEAKALFVWRTDGTGHVVLWVGSKVIDPDCPTQEIAVSGDDVMQVAKQVNDARSSRYGAATRSHKGPGVAKARALTL